MEEMLKKCTACTETDCEVRTFLEYISDIGGLDNFFLQVENDELPLEIEIVFASMLAYFIE